MTLSSRIKSGAADVTRGLVGVVAGLGLVVAIAAAPARALAQTPAAPAIQGDGPALWVVRDADSTLYLFGSVHVLRPETGWNSPRVAAAFDSASDVWFELSNPDDQAAIVPLMQRYGLSPDTPLSSRLTPEDQAKLAAAAAAIGVSAEQLEPMRPWLAALSLAVAPLLKAGYDPQSGVEMALKARAEAAGKPVHGFETVEHQVGVLATLPDDVQLALLRDMLDDYDKATEMLDALVQAWAVGDVAAINRLVVQDMKLSSPALYRAVLVERNADWAAQIKTMLDGSGTAFIAVGAGHLVGDDSVQALLARQGVQTTRVE